MALATQCPHCHTTFRVAHDQLKLRAGLVRCGACKQIFNGVENLVPIDLVQAPPPASATVMSSPPAEPGDLSTAQDRAESDQHEPTESPHGSAETPGVPAGDGQRIEPTIAPVARAPDDPLLRMTLLDFAPLKRRSADDVRPVQPAPAPDSASDPLERVMNELQNGPAGRIADAPAGPPGPAIEAEPDEPLFMRQGRRRERMGKTLRRLMAAGSLALLLGLLGQAFMLARNELAAAYPALRPTLRAACAAFGCEIALPARIDAVSIESSELQAINPESHVFALTTLLRNRSATPQAWPDIELTLTDNADKAVARRVFTASDYLPAGVSRERGFGPRSEQPVKVVFELSQLDASGYRVYLFYP